MKTVYLMILLGMVPIACIPVVWALVRKRRTGTVLLDLGRSGQWLMALFCLVLFVSILALLLLLLLDDRWEGMPTYIPLALIILFLSLGTYPFLATLSRRQILDTGVWVFPTLVPWEKVVSYNWRQDLVLRVKWGSHIVNLYIHCPRTEALDALLAEHVAPAPSAQQ